MTKEIQDISLVMALDYLQTVIVSGQATYRHIADVLGKMVDVKFPVHINTEWDIGIAILGTSIAMMKSGHTTVMSPEQGIQLEIYCIQALDKLLPAASVFRAKADLDDYQKEYERCYADHENPFLGISGVMLIKCLEDEVYKLCDNETVIDPIILTVVGDIMALTVMGPLKFLKKLGSQSN